MSNSIVIKPIGGAAGYSTEPFPIVEILPVIRSAFNAAANGETDGQRRVKQPLVYAVPLNGVIAQAEEGNVESDGFQKPNFLMRSVWGAPVSQNQFGDLDFSIKPSAAKLPNSGGPAQYLLKIKLPGRPDDWKTIDPSASVTINIGKHQAWLDSTTLKEIMALHISVDPKAENMDEGFTSFKGKEKKPQPYVLTFELPDYISAEDLVNSEVTTPKGMQVVDRRNGYLNIVLPVREDGGLKTAAIPGLGREPG